MRERNSLGKLAVRVRFALPCNENIFCSFWLYIAFTGSPNLGAIIRDFPVNYLVRDDAFAILSYLAPEVLALPGNQLTLKQPLGLMLAHASTHAQVPDACTFRLTGLPGPSARRVSRKKLEKVSFLNPART